MTGDDIVILGDKHVGEPYALGALVPKNDADYKGPWDSAEFVSWLYYQTFGILYGCDAAGEHCDFWDRDTNTKGQIVTIEEAKSTPGAVILRLAGNGTVGHIVISDGNGGTVEAHGREDGIVNSVVDGRRWDMGVLVPGVAYNPNPILTYRPPSIPIYRLTSPNMVTTEIGKIQAELTRRGFDTGGVDNIFGEMTYNAVKLFQDSVGLNPDGEVSAFTAAVLDAK
ncbi:MAG TPA: peptidoglycan-binding domain-containing protein [Mucilaginibacter sp.]|jgi:N-acetylmuramoyl-L-alanine amidase|nr:peptidoglycan-binding domain-containing protein [Mucilaginibacter sp.]